MGRLRTIGVFLIFTGSWALAEVQAQRLSAAQIEHDSTHARVIDLAGLWRVWGEKGGEYQELPLPGYHARRGWERFSRIVQVNAEDDLCKVLVLFQRMDSPFSLYLDEKFIAGGHGGGLPVSLPIPTNLLTTDSTHHLSIRIDSRLGAQNSIPLKTRLRGLPPRGRGIPEEIEMLLLRSPYLSAVEWVQPGPEMQEWTFRFLWELEEAKTADYRCSFGIEEISSGQTIWKSRRAERLTTDTLVVEVPLAPIEVWTPENPHRYRL
ncbi:hypothetical protein JW992_14040, partial [candidate division KSB1 bacterium]|nr:hypothetical protein [candidate division KSB1 bacterium]